MTNQEAPEDSPSETWLANEKQARLREKTVEELQQMLSAPSDAYSAGEWCFAANDLMEECERLRSSLEMVVRMALNGVGPETTAEQCLETIAEFVKIRLSRRTPQ